MTDVDAVARVRAAVTAGRPPDRKSIEHALREAFGMSARQAKRFTAQGIKALGEADDQNIDEFVDRLQVIERALKL